MSLERVLAHITRAVGEDGTRLKGWRPPCEQVLLLKSLVGQATDAVVTQRKTQSLRPCLQQFQVNTFYLESAWGKERARGPTPQCITSCNLLICHNMIIYIHTNVPLDPIEVLTSVSWPKSISSHCMLPTEIPQFQKQRVRFLTSCPVATANMKEKVTQSLRYGWKSRR